MCEHTHVHTHTLQLTIIRQFTGARPHVLWELELRCVRERGLVSVLVSAHPFCNHLGNVFMRPRAGVVHQLPCSHSHQPLCCHHKVENKLFECLRGGGTRYSRTLLVVEMDRIVVNAQNVSRGGTAMRMKRGMFSLLHTHVDTSKQHIRPC